ncbi:transducin beta-like protein 3 [Hemicordylus capensis]|uniref:transducin beta-like protein 3 n=1 Tax=Hemicordylus capensis TaxID=884348 RepID=UPI0023026558|nr:transducin beta-like protein 3 [Hemicordylus capensis]
MVPFYAIAARRKRFDKEGVRPEVSHASRKHVLGPAAATEAGAGGRPAGVAAMSASSLRGCKLSYVESKRIEPFYTGGQIQISQDGEYMFCACGSKVNILEMATGILLHSIEQDDQDEITVFVVSSDDEILVTASQSLLLKQWDWDGEKCVRTWKAIHTAPVASMAFDPTSTLLATGSCDSTIKVWDVTKQYCTHNLKGSSGVVNIVEFHPDTSQLQLFSSSSDNIIRVWDLTSSQCVAQLENHYSSVTSLAFSEDSKTLISSGRDQICTVWDLDTKEAQRTIPVYETVESVALLPEKGDFSQLGVKKSSIHFITAGSKGIIRIWDAFSTTCVHSQSLPHLPEASKEEGSGEHRLVHCVLVPGKSEIVTVNADQNIVLYDAETLEPRKQFAGNNGEVLDVRFIGPGDSHIVVATNSPQLKVFDLATSHCQILYGHTDSVLALDAFRRGMMFSSCAKDKTFRIWRMKKTSGEVFCVAQGLGHAHSVGSLACSRTKENFVVTAGQDCTIKLWYLPESVSSKSKTDNVETLNADVTEKAHTKDINSVAVSPNDKLIATGSQDKTAKLWSTDSCTHLGTFSGHKRGVWCVQFSPVDQVLATTSADGTVKLWGLQDFSCLKTFQGHDASVLKLIFVNQGTQLVTSGSDGLLKLWTIKNNECVKTLDGHTDKVWGLDGNKQNNLLVTGSADASVVLWKDVTDIELEEAQAKQDEEILKEQELSNLLHEKQYLKALGLALSLDRPHTVLTVVKAILKENSGKEDLEKNILKLRKDQKEAVLKYSVTWNTNSRNCHEAQAVVETLLKHETPDSLLQYEGIKAAVESLLPYTERHFQRLSRLLQASMFLDFMWQNMRLASASTPDEDMET